MVKLPVVVYNRTTRQSVIQDAIQLRGSIEQEAIAAEAAGGKYIRPIVLFQAQPRTGDNSDTFDKIKAMLVGMGIAENQIAVKTSNVDDLKGQDLMSRDCEIRYIITVNALKEGWDCPPLPTYWRHWPTALLPWMWSRSLAESCGSRMRRSTVRCC